MAVSSSDMQPVLDVRDLRLKVSTSSGTGFEVVSGVTFDIRPGEIVCLVGESGSGKSMTALSLMGLSPPAIAVGGGQILFNGKDIVGMSEQQMETIRGRQIGMVFQDPMTALNPVVRVGHQIAECIGAHEPKLRGTELRRRAVEMLALVGIPSPEERFDVYPHQMSGGMRQRVVIAMALANHPKLIIADEPTTALDVTVQAQVLDAMRNACEKAGAAVLLITHDMGVVAEIADRVMVFYAGRIVEEGVVQDVFRQPRHPYTRSLLASIPRLGASPDEELSAIPGEPPSLAQLPTGCVYQPRCYLYKGRPVCKEQRPRLENVEPQHRSACHFASELASSSGLHADEVSTQ